MYQVTFQNTNTFETYTLTVTYLELKALYECHYCKVMVATPAA